MTTNQPVERQTVTLEDYIQYLNSQIAFAKERNLIQREELNWKH